MPTYTRPSPLDCHHLEAVNECIFFLKTCYSSLLNVNMVILCITDILAPIATRVSDSINDAFENDLFILSFVYKNTGERFHALVILSNIERSLEKPSLKELPPTYLHELIRKALPQYEIGVLYQNALYLFSNKDNTIAYDGIFHISCELKEKI